MNKIRLEAKNISQVVAKIAEATDTIKDDSIRGICKEIRQTGQADSFDYTGFRDSIECDFTVWVDYNPISKIWVIEIDE